MLTWLTTRVLIYNSVGKPDTSSDDPWFNRASLRTIFAEGARAQPAYGVASVPEGPLHGSTATELTVTQGCSFAFSLARILCNPESPPSTFLPPRHESPVLHVSSPRLVLSPRLCCTVSPCCFRVTSKFNGGIDPRERRARRWEPAL